MGFLRSFSVDDDLVSGFITGSDASFEGLMGRYATELFNTALYISGDLDIAEQVLTEVFCEAYREIPEAIERTTVKLWFYRLTVKMTLKLMEDRIIAVPSISSSTGDTGITRERVMEAINRLPVEYNVVFVLKDINRFSNLDVAEVLELDNEQFQARLNRARLMILRDIDNREDIDDNADMALEKLTKEVLAEVITA